MNRQMHLSCFMLFCAAPHMTMSWVYPREKIRHQWYEVEYWAEIAQTLERGKFDMFFFADAWAGGGNATSVRYGIQFPNQDPLALLPYLAAVTDNLGFAVTLSTTFYPPYMAARKLATLDHVTKGRIGWNVVTSIGDGEARNFSLERMLPHDERYDRADEYMDVCNALWNSWDDDALLMDMENGIFADPTKIHRVDHEGKYFKVQGPLTVIPSPQGRPYIFQAGQSARGREFAAKHAECIFARIQGADQMHDFCDDIAARAEAYGRDPNEIKIMWAAQPIVADTAAEANERQLEIRGRISLEASLTLLSSHLDMDITKLDLDKPIGNLEVTGIQGVLEAYQKADPSVTLREMASSFLTGSDTGPSIGTPKQVAEHMVYLLEEGGGDGFQITPSYYAPDYFADLTDKLIPELQRLGVFRREYEAGTMRDRMRGAGFSPTALPRQEARSA